MCNERLKKLSEQLSKKKEMKQKKCVELMQKFQSLMVGISE